jgi:transposase
MQPRVLCLHSSTVKKLLRLRKEAETDGQYRVAKRIHAVLLNNDKKTSGEISNLLKIPRSSVTLWLSNYENYGYDSLLEGHRTGRPGYLTDKQKTELSDIVDSGPIAYGYMSGIWTSIMIAQIIKNEFSVSYDPRHVRRILDEMNFSVQRPKRILANADPLKQSRWTRYIYPNLKKKPRTMEV